VLAQTANVQIVTVKIDVIAVIPKQHVIVIMIVRVTHNKKNRQAKADSSKSMATTITIQGLYSSLI
jgi:hypothetical protein